MANDGTVKIGAEIDEKEFKSGLSKLSSVAKAGLTGATAAIGAATAAATAGTVAVGKLAQSAISAYSDYEQLVGGVETLFKTSSATVMQYANNAYKTAGLSANEYMDTVTSFSASLLQGLGGDTEAAAQIANKAIVDMADNANKMGTDMASIQYAYQGFAKQNYTMLDNLKLGYGGTQAEMARLINDSGVLGDTMQVTAQTVNQVSFDKIIEAIHVVQERMGIAGTTAKEASETIQGSVNAMKGAWENFITGMADGDQDIGQLTENLVDSVLTVADNLVPRLQELLPRLAEGLGQLAENLLPYIPPILETLLPALIDGSTALVTDIANRLPQVIAAVFGALPSLFGAGIQIITAIGRGITEAIPALREIAGDIIGSLSSSLDEHLPTLIENGLTFLENFASSFRENAGLLVDSGIQLVLSLAQGLADSFPTIIEKLPGIVSDIAGVINDNAPKLLMAGMNLIITLGLGLIMAIPALIKNIPQIILAIVDVITAFNWMNLGKGIIDGFLNGVKGMFGNVKVTVQTIVQNIRTVFSDLPGYLKAIGKDMIKGLWEGIKSMVSWIKDNIVGFIKGIAGSLSGSMRKEAESAAKSSSGGSSKARSAPESPNSPRPSPVSMSPAGDFSGETAGNEDGSYSLTASDFSRAAAVRALESAIPNAVSRVSVSTAAMAPAAGDGGNKPRSLAAEVAEAVHNELNGMEVTMDGRTVGRMVTKQQNNIGRAFGTA